MIYIVLGPTGSGKTSVSLKLSERFNAPIINADAFQIYDEMNIGTAKIESGHPLFNRHYLLNIKKPNETYSVKQFQDDFRSTLNDLLNKYNDIIVCGGTGLYIRASLFDYEFKDEEDANTSKYDSLDNHTLWLMLKKIDEISANKIHENNRKRVIRALIYYDQHQKSKSEHINEQEHKVIYHDVRFLFINPSRESLFNNINNRVDKMIKNGLVDEVRYLKSKYNLSLTAKEAIGYKEIIDYLNDKCSLETAIEQIKKRTRNYAKRQITFFKHQFNCEEFPSGKKLLEKVLGNEKHTV